MSDAFDALVVGSGVMGSAVALELGRRGSRVGLLDRFAEGHARGSSHGPTRIFRLSYKDPAYVELAMQAMDDWARLERDGDETLLMRVGGIDCGAGATENAEAMAVAGVGFEEWSEQRTRDTYGLIVDRPAIFQPDAAIIAARTTVATQRRLAARSGAVVRDGWEVTRIEVHGSTARVMAAGEWIETGCLILAAGSWMKGLAAMAGVDLQLAVTSEQVTYLRTARKQMPIIVDWSEPALYLVPEAFGAAGARVGLHHAGMQVDPEDGPFAPSDAVSNAALERVQTLIGQSADIVAAETCLYTNTADEDFIIQRHGPVLTLSACSGHGFKFGPRIGRLVADLIDEVPTGAPLRLSDLWSSAA